MAIMYLTDVFTGEYGLEETKMTDVDWSRKVGREGARSEFNYRMVLPVTVPTKVPRIKLAVRSASCSPPRVLFSCASNVQSGCCRAGAIFISAVYELIACADPAGVE